MAGTMTRSAFEQFCNEHIEWLKEQIGNEHSLEMRWIILLLEDAPARYYDGLPPVVPFCD